MIFGWLYLRGPRLPRLKSFRVGDAYQRWRQKRLRKKFQVYYQKTRGDEEDDEKKR
jgi:hypothetical protein